MDVRWNNTTYYDCIVVEDYEYLVKKYEKKKPTPNNGKRLVERNKQVKIHTHIHHLINIINYV